jgi:hypothetical protein
MSNGRVFAISYKNALEYVEWHLRYYYHRATEGADITQAIMELHENLVRTIEYLDEKDQ